MKLDVDLALILFTKEQLESDFVKSLESLELADDLRMLENNRDIKVVGYPDGTSVTETTGKVSSITYTNSAFSNMSQHLLLISAPVNSGNSGGPIIEEVGEKRQVSGVVCQVKAHKQNMGYATPIHALWNMITQYCDTGKVNNSFTFPFQVEYLTDPTMRTLRDLPNDNMGILIQSVLKPFSFTPRMDLQAEDILLEVIFNGTRFPIASDGRITIQLKDGSNKQVRWRYISEIATSYDVIKIKTCRTSLGRTCIITQKVPMTFGLDSIRQVPLIPSKTTSHYYIDSGFAFLAFTNSNAGRHKTQKHTGIYRSTDEGSTCEKVAIRHVDMGLTVVDSARYNNFQIKQINGLAIRDVFSVRSSFFWARLMEHAKTIMELFDSTDNQEVALSQSLKKFSLKLTAYRFSESDTQAQNKAATKDKILTALLKALPGNYCQQKAAFPSIAECKSEKNPKAALEKVIRCHKPFACVTLCGEDDATINTVIKLMPDEEQARSLERIGTTRQSSLPSHRAHWRSALAKVTDRLRAKKRMAASLMFKPTEEAKADKEAGSAGAAAGSKSTTKRARDTSFGR